MTGRKPIGLQRFADPAFWSSQSADRKLFEEQLADFVPPGAFDAHAHWYALEHLLSNDEFTGEKPVGFDAMQQSQKTWMGGSAPKEGLFFPFPTRTVDCAAANKFLAEQLAEQPQCRGLMLTRPDDRPEEVEDTLKRHGFSGFKVYHLLAEREDSFYCEQQEFLPDWAWELAHRYELWITMHLVLPKALSDLRNVDYIRNKCREFPQAKFVLAHAGRGFNAGHTVRAIDQLRGVDNVFFDTSAVCEPAAFEAILRATGCTRLMYGSDFPVSEIRGRAVSIADGFAWLYENNVDWEAERHGQPTLIGIESLLALRQACTTMCLTDRDLAKIFGGNARELLRIESPSDGPAKADEARAHYQRAKQRIPGGTQLLSKRPEMFAPKHWPAYYEQAIGCEVVDSGGRRFTDLSLGGILACPLGYSDPDVNAAVIRRIHLGSTCTQQSYDEVELAELLCELHPWADMARYARSGGEAMAIAVRIARAATKRDKVAICGYHGWHDWYLAANLAQENRLAGHLLPGLEPLGVPAGLAGDCLTFHYNRLDQLDALLRDHNDIAAIVMEPVRHTDPAPGFLDAVRERATAEGAKLVFDEISVGWRRCVGGAHLQYALSPDIAVFAKGISNGFPMGAIIGNRETMSAAQSTFISSTSWTEGVGPAAALAAIRKMQKLNTPSHLAQIGARFQDAWRELSKRYNFPVAVTGRPDATIIRFEHEQANALMTLFTIRMLERGIMACGGFNPTQAHQPHHIDLFRQQAASVLPELVQCAERGDVLERIDHEPKHTGFARLTD